MYIDIVCKLKITYKLVVKYWQKFVSHNLHSIHKSISLEKFTFLTFLHDFTYYMSMYILSVNVIYSLFADKMHTVYIL